MKKPLLMAVGVAALALLGSACSPRAAVVSMSPAPSMAARHWSMTPDAVAKAAHLRVRSDEVSSTDTYLPRDMSAAPWSAMASASAAAGLPLGRFPGEAVTIYEYPVVGAPGATPRFLVLVKQWHDLIGAYISTDASPSVITSIGVRLLPPT